MSKRIGDSIGITQYDSPDVDISEIEKMLESDPLNEGLLAIAALTYYSSEELEKALYAYEKLLSINMRSAEYHYCLGNTYYRLGRRDEAFKEWQMTANLDEGGRYARRARRRMEEARLQS
jgi:tetratricopeptide (TPR) repeat protein